MAVTPEERRMIEEQVRLDIAADLAEQADIRAAVHTDPDDPMQGLIEGIRFAARRVAGDR